MMVGRKPLLSLEARAAIREAARLRAMLTNAALAAKYGCSVRHIATVTRTDRLLKREGGTGR